MSDEILERCVAGQAVPDVDLMPAVQDALTELQTLRTENERLKRRAKEATAFANKELRDLRDFIDSKNLKECESEIIRRRLTVVGEKKFHAFKTLGISRSTLDRKIEEYGIEIDVNDQA